MDGRLCKFVAFDGASIWLDPREIASVYPHGHETMIEMRTGTKFVVKDAVDSIAERLNSMVNAMQDIRRFGG